MLTQTAGAGKGSSPHVRGAQHWAGPFQQNGGIIPACAGSTITRLCARPKPRDHPRMCGEHAFR